MRVNKVVYIALAILLGSFGVHKFYSGQKGLGVLCLLFFWTGIPHIIAIIDAIITLFFKPADENGNIAFN